LGDLLLGFFGDLVRLTTVATQSDKKDASKDESNADGVNQGDLMAVLEVENDDCEDARRGENGRNYTTINPRFSSKSKAR